MKRGVWTLFALSAYQRYAGEQSDTWALDNVVRELGRERTIAMSLPEFEQSLFMAAQPRQSATGDRAALLSITAINSTNCRWLLPLPV